MKNLFLLLIFALFSTIGYSQEELSKYAGKYGDWTLNGDILNTELELNIDGTFKLRTTDPIYTNKFQEYTNEGKWILKNGEVFLNPELKKRTPIVKISEKQIELKDAIKIKINHYIEVYENEQIIEKQKKEFDMLTLYFNKKRKYKHLTREWMKDGNCAFAPRIKNRINLDSTNTFTIAKQDIKKIGVFTYGFTDFIELATKNKNANFFEIDVIIPIDKERMPRNKKVIVKGKRAYFYEHNGKVSKWLNPLRKKTT